ncbi:uncharacterized protein LOC124407951 [Diprion similis]|uniref:uncharacterized protein LOC124407951 n=1 Tax=Diprion similis TaxID=362088 RepID=UPI001EF8C1B8|nr:uncharacterized protein LOC124407951 [Diprion similis]
MDNVNTKPKERTKQEEAREHSSSGRTRGYARSRGTRGRGLVRGISWPPLESMGSGDASPQAPASNVLTETERGEDAPLQEAPDEAPLQQQQQQSLQGNKRKGDELTPPENIVYSDGELSLPYRSGAEDANTQRKAASTEGEGKGTVILSDEEEAPRPPMGTRPRRKRCTATAKVAYLEDDSDTGETDSVWSAKDTNPWVTKKAPAGRQKKGKAAARLQEETPQGTGPVEYRLMTASDLGAQITEWLEDIDAIRGKCKLQGQVSSEIKSRVALAKEALLTMTVKAEAAGDPALLRARNNDLEAQLRDARRERDELQLELEKNRHDQERAGVDARNRTTVSYAQVASRGSTTSADERLPGAVRKTTALDLGVAARSEVEAIEVPTTAASAGTSEFEFRLTGSQLELIPDNDRARNEELARQAEALKQVREEVNRISRLLLSATSGGGRAHPNPPHGMGSHAGGTAQGMHTAQTSCVQATAEGGQRLSEDRGTSDPPMEVEGSTGARDRRSGTNKTRKGKPPGGETSSGAIPEAVQTSPTEAPGRTGGTGPSAVRRRAPRGAAVAIKGKGENVRYAEILKFAREKIQLEELGIGETRIRRAANGGVLIEIPGPENAKKADALAVQLTRVIAVRYGDTVSVTRPVTKGELRVQGLDGSMSSGELAGILAEQGGCKPDEIRVGVPRGTPNGLFSVWVQCPLRAATIIASKGKIRIGWVTARAVLLDARPRQCFKCWGFGRIGSACKEPTERRAACYRCGTEGHQARDCAAKPKCAVCQESGKDSAHRMGSGRCASVGERGRRPATNPSENGQVCPE